MIKHYEVEWSYTTKLGYCYTEIKAFDSEQEQQEFASKKYSEENVYEVRQITETIWRKA